MINWQVGDIAIAIGDHECPCGHHKIETRKAYRVQNLFLHPFDPREDNLYLDVLTDGHAFHHSCFRKEQKADQDIFRLCDAPVDEKLLEDA